MSGPSSILLVEDDRDEVAVALRALERAGLDVPVTIAADGLEALEALGLEAGGSSPTPPRVVFLDLKMPRVDGFEVLRRIRGHPRTSDLPVVVLSSSDRPEDIARSYALGANSFLLKRFDRQSPGRYFAEAARYWLELNRTPQAGG
jgi:two-component system response regulator